MIRRLSWLLAFLPGVAFGAVQNALIFDGTGDAAACPTSVGNFRQGDNFSVLVYAYFTTAPASDRDFFWDAGEDTVNDTQQIGFSIAPSELVVPQTNASDFTTFFPAFTTGTWYAVVCRNTGATTTLDCRKYAEAGSSPTDTGAGSWADATTNAVRFTLGARWRGDSSTYIGDLAGRVAHVAVLSETISDAEANSYASDPINTVHGWVTTKAATLELWLENAANISGGAVVDASGNARNCTLVANATSTSSGPNVPNLSTDTTPDNFTFTDQTGVSLSATITSAAITVSGINAASAITVTGGTYDKNASGTFVGTAGTVVNGDTVRARHTSSGSNATQTNTTVTIGGVSDIFTSTTLAAGGSLLLRRRR